MKNLKLLFVLLIFLPNLIFCQDNTEYSKVKTNTGEVKIPGKWEQLNKMDDSGQTYLRNTEGVIIAIAQNPKKAYPFYKSNVNLIIIKSLICFSKFSADLLFKLIFSGKVD